MRRALLLAGFVLLPVSAWAAELVVIAPSTIVNDDEYRDEAEQLTDRTLQQRLRSRGYAVEKARKREDLENTAFLEELLATSRATLAVSVKIEGARAGAVKNGWSVVVRALRRGEKESHTAKGRCEKCFLGKEAQKLLVAALDRVLNAPAGRAVSVTAMASPDEMPTTTPLVTPAEPKPTTPQGIPPSLTTNSIVESTLSPPTETRRSWWQPQRMAGVALVAGGAALALSSIAPFVLDGSCSDEGHCYYRRDTKTTGITLATAGAAVAVSGAIVILTTPREPVQAALVPMASLNGVGLVAVGRF